MYNNRVHGALHSLQMTLHYDAHLKNKIEIICGPLPEEIRSKEHVTQVVLNFLANCMRDAFINNIITFNKNKSFSLFAFILMVLVTGDTLFGALRRFSFAAIVFSSF